MKKYGLIGYPLGHSFSRNFFNQKFQSENIDAEYVNFEIKDIRELKDVVHDHPNLCVIKFRRGNFGKLKLIGHNSDITGFKQSIDPLLHESHTKALILGTGGASKAVFHGLKQLGIGATYVSRSKQNSCFTYDELTPRIMEQYTVIVNTTPLGMYPKVDECPNIPYDWVNSDHLLYDLLYNPDETLFMRKGKERGAVVKNGLEMLLLQAFAAWDIWNG